LDREEYGVGMRSGDLQFQSWLIDAMNRIKGGVRGSEISKQWFGEDILLK
jgi:ABC-type amino acid transport substrate-binding protein